MNHLTCISLLRKPGKSGIRQDDWPFACLQSTAVCDWQALMWARWMPSPNKNGGEPAAADPGSLWCSCFVFLMT